MNFTQSLRTLILALILSIGIGYAYAAWSPPSTTPTGGNTDAPVNVGSATQVKAGALTIGQLLTAYGTLRVGSYTAAEAPPVDGMIVKGNVGIGTASPDPAAKLEVVSGSCYYRFQTDGLHTNCTVGNPGTTVSITADTANYNLANALGNPTMPTNVTLTIQTGVTVYSNTTSEAALDTGILPPGSTITIINNGTIIGKGGIGGRGGNWLYNQSGENGLLGEDGGSAIRLRGSAYIDNTNGYIFGGGGGGGGGGSSGIVSGMGGGGGGGGAGSAPGTGGVGGVSLWGAPLTPGDPGASSPGSVGGPGGSSGCSKTSSCGGVTSPGWSTGDGGSGGGYGQSGLNGLNGACGGCTTPQGGSGGNPGNAVNTNGIGGGAVFWIGGNTPTQVKGPVN